MARTEVEVIEPGKERGNCPHCGKVVVVRFDECGADVEGICPECKGSVWSPSDSATVVWFALEAAMVDGEYERT